MRRVEEINSIVQKLLSRDNYILLHAHRQAVKTSMLLPISDVFLGKNDYMKLQKEKYQEDVLNSVPKERPDYHLVSVSPPN